MFSINSLAKIDSEIISIYYIKSYVKYVFFLKSLTWNILFFLNRVDINIIDYPCTNLSITIALKKCQQQSWTKVICPPQYIKNTFNKQNDNTNSINNWKIEIMYFGMVTFVCIMHDTCHDLHL
jgi:hypothetical protein